MPIRSRQNLYPGINPHLNSYLQRPAHDWASFHALHISRITDYLDENLPTGYYASEETSLQIRTTIGEESTQQRTVADVGIYRRPTVPTIPPTQTQTATPIMTFPHTDVFAEDREMTAVTIRRINTAVGEIEGRVVTRIELLSPGNLAGGTHHQTYLAKRQLTLQSMVNLVELDYLHELPPLFAGMPDYSAADPDAPPYNILITNPQRGQTDVYGVYILQALPTLAIPLDSTNSHIVDFDAIYQQTFSGRRRHWEAIVDYEHEPTNMDAYRAADQAKIRQRMGEIASTKG